MVFDKARQKVDTLINDRITAPVKTAVIISVTAFILAGIALMVAVENANR